MGARVRGVLILSVVLIAGAFLGSALGQWWTEPESIPAIPGSFHRFGVNERVRVEVLNGGGRAGMARAATDELRSAGFDVVDFGNAGEFGRDSSVVYSRAGELEYARAVADALGVTDVRIEPDENLYVDVSVVLGSAWEPRPAEEVVTESRPWWDPRNWFKRPGAPAERLVDPGDEG